MSDSDEDDDGEATDLDWMKAADCIASDLDNFEAFLWPQYRERGFSRETAVLCFYLHLVVVEKRTGAT